MSFCPSKDIHSIYLDNEMPEEFKKEYEEHLKGCPKCQKELAKLKAVHELYQEDSKLISMDAKFMDESFEKLQVKLNYSKHTYKGTSSFSVNKLLYGISAAAAVALFAVFVPFRTSASNAGKSGSVSVAAAPSAVTPAASNVSFGGSGNGVVLSGNIHESVMSPKNGALLHDISSKKMAKKLINDVDVIKPDLGDETISIRITVPGINSVPVTREIELPVNVISGYFE